LALQASTAATMSGASSSRLRSRFFSFGVDLIAGMERTLVDPLAPQGCKSPALRASQIARPERPGPALRRADGVYPAFADPVDGGHEEGAILVTVALDQRVSPANLSDVLPPHLALGNVKVLGDLGDLIRGHPDVPLPGTGAACPAPRALKRQAPGVPRIFPRENLHDGRYQYTRRTTFQVWVTPSSPRGWLRGRECGWNRVWAALPSSNRPEAESQCIRGPPPRNRDP